MSKYKIGLALSGGGMRGIAHAGVFKFLESQKLEIDVIAGTSAGAIAGALYGFGKTPNEILEFFQSVHFFNWRHLVFNKPGLVGSKMFAPYIEPVFGHAKIKDSRIPLLITATDMCTGKLKIFDEETEIVDAIIASSAIPGVATPYKIGQEMYCDGGVLNNFPADLLIKSTRKIIGVYLSRLQEIEPSQITTLKSVAERALEILLNRTETGKFKLCDWLIRVDGLAEYGRFETDPQKTLEIFDLGFRSAELTFNDLSKRTRRILHRVSKHKFPQ